MNVTALIDQRPLTGLQYRIFLLGALVALLDGADYQIIGLVAPLIGKEFNLARSAVGWVFAAGTLGAAIGAWSCGLVADLIGRQKTLVASTALFGVATLLTTQCGGIVSLAGLRFVTGLGLGGALPCFIALTSEYAPARRRTTFVSLIWAGFPLGGMTGGFVNAYLLHSQHADWRQLFVIWGLLPLVVALVLALWLPESVRFLLARQIGMDKVRGIVSRIAGTRLSDTQSFVSTEEHLAGLPLTHLFTEGRARATIPLWIMLFIVLGSLTILSTWTPALLGPLGISPAQAAFIVGMNGLGSFIGSSSAGRLMEYFGIRACLVTGFVLCAVAVMIFGSSGILGAFTADLGTGFAIMSFITGIVLGVSSANSIALSAVVYPTAIRSTGAGWGVGMGRFGAVIGPLLITMMVGMGASVQDIFLTVGIGLLIPVPCVIALALYRDRHAAAETASEPAGEYVVNS